ncbi:MAG: hypothetical protein NVSMB29_00670 [Candidatus Dormibacteria bacterium]
MPLLVRRTGPALAAATLLGAAAAALGLPDLRSARGFLAGNAAAQPGALAVASVIVWALVVATAAALLVAIARTSTARIDGRRRRWRGACMLLLCGFVLLAVGASRHAPPLHTLCCGNLHEARDLAR